MGDSALASITLSLVLSGTSIFSASAPLQSIANLRKLGSFRYVLEMSRTEMPVIKGSFSGVVHLPDTQEQVGAWNQAPKMRVRSRGDFEYMRYESQTPGFDTMWSVHARGEEAFFLTQVERVLMRDSSRLLRQDRRYAEYTFVPNLPFLDPTLTKQLSGQIRILRDKALPEEISVTSSDRVVTWTARFSDFDRAPAIEFPFVPQWRVALVPDSTAATDAVGVTAGRRDSVLLRQRLHEIGFESRIVPRGETLVLSVERSLRGDLLPLLAGTGRTEVWIGRYFEGTGPVPESGRKAIFADAQGRAMVLERPLIDAKEIVDLSVEDTLEGQRLRLQASRDAESRPGKIRRLENASMFLALVMDDAVWGIREITGPAPGLEFGRDAPLNSQQAKVLTAVVRSGPLARTYRVVSMGPVRN